MGIFKSSNLKRPVLIAVLLIITCMACNKVDTEPINSTIKNSSAVEFTDTVKIPVNDLGTGTYRGFAGGLYPGGVNDPSGQYKKDLKKFSNDIIPLNGTGESDTSVGKIGFISLGGSTCGRNMTSLKKKTAGNPLTNPFLALANCANGSGEAR